MIPKYLAGAFLPSPNGSSILNATARPWFVVEGEDFEVEVEGVMEREERVERVWTRSPLLP